MTGLTRSVSLVNLYRECGWVTLNNRRKEQKLAFMYKAVNDLTPDYIYDLIPHFVIDTTNHPLRNNKNLAVTFTRTEISRKSCIPSSIAEAIDTVASPIIATKKPMMPSIPIARG